MATIKDVAKAAGVSTATVSHVINNTRYVSDKVRKNVMDAIAKLDYTPSVVAQSMRNQKTKTIGLLIPIIDDEMSNIFFIRVSKGIELVLKKNGYRLLFSNTDDDLDREIEQIENFNRQQIDGLIIAACPKDHSFFDDIVKNKYPAIFIDRKPEGISKDFVLNDGYGGSYDAVSYLISKGHKRIAILSGLINWSTGFDRLEGYKKALADHQIAIDDSLIFVGDSTCPSGYNMAKKMHEMKLDATALFIASNAILMGAIEYFGDIEIKIPEDYAIIGFDNNQWTKTNKPSLSVVEQASYELGKKAANLLLKKIKKSSSEYKTYKIPTKLIIRDSC